LKIALIEAGDLKNIRSWTQPQGTYSNRVSSITNASKAFLHGEYIFAIFEILALDSKGNFYCVGIGAWDHVEESRTRPVEDMQVTCFLLCA